MPPSRSAPAIVVLSDIEGRWDKLARFCERQRFVTIDAADRIEVAPGAVFVFGGDAIDRGPAGRRILRALLAARLRQPEQVVLLAGNRDINKMRLRAELSGRPPGRTPEAIAAGAKGPLLAWIFRNTMGARDAFEHRRAELGVERGEQVTDDEVAESYREDVSRDGLLTAYLAACQLAYRAGETLFVHGAVTDESLGHVPGLGAPERDVDRWVERLNAFYKGSAEAFASEASAAIEAAPWAALVAYQAPVRGTRKNQASVVYGRPFDDEGRPELPTRDVIEALKQADLRRLVVGHTPVGDSPALLRDRDFELVLADNSYGLIETGSAIVIEGSTVSVGSEMVVDGERAEVRFEAQLGESASALGMRVAETGDLIKGRLAAGDLIRLHALGDFRYEETTLAPEALRNERLAYRPT